MFGTFSLKQRSWYPWAFLVGAIAVLLASVYCPWEIFRDQSLTIISMLGAFFAFLYAQHLQQTQLFNDLFRTFNSRYDSLNDKLEGIVGSGVGLSEADKAVLVDYFNLCAEEYLFFKSGYIDVSVWRSWVNGMSYYAKQNKIRALWEEELRSNSYYGFSLSCLKFG